jgi:hypothetical protein
MTQTIDFRFEALFLLLALTSLVLLLVAIVLKTRAHGSVAKRLLTLLGVGWCVYLSIVFIVAAATPQIVVNPRQDLCFDEMCFAVTNVQTADRLSPSIQSGGTFYVVTVRVINHARGRAMKENGLRAVLRAAHDTYEVTPVGQAAWDQLHPRNVPLTAFLQPQQGVLSDQVFDVPKAAGDLGLVLSNGFTPGYFVIGESPLFHKPTILRLPQIR